MKIELNIDASNIGETVLDVFKTLSDEQKNHIASEVLNRWLKEPDEIHRTSLHRDAIKYARDRYSWNSEKPDDYFLNTSDYREYIRRNPTPKEAMIKEITSQVIDHHKKEITALIKTDPEIHAMMQETFAAIKADFPKIVNDAMIAWFCGNMSQMAHGISTALMQSNQTSDMVKEISDKVLGR